MKILILLIAICFSTFAYCSDHNTGAANDAKFAPQLNPNPKYFMTVEGNISQKIIGKARLNFKINYVTKNKNCSIVINKFEGVTRPRQKALSILIKTDNRGNYTSKVPIDGLYRGYCDWQPESFAYKINNNEYWPVAVFTKAKTAAHNIVKNIKVCHYDKTALLKCRDSTFPYFSGDSKINKNKNYKYVLNLLYEDN